MKKSLLFVILICVGVVGTTSSLAMAQNMSCQEGLIDKIENKNVQINLEYLKKTKGKFGIKNFKNKNTNKSLYIKGNEKLLIMFHGFMASPYEMKALAEYLHERSGYSIYMPLIPGLGAHYKVGKKYGFDDWEKSIIDNIELSKDCFKEIGLVGYSIGAGLLTNYILREKQKGNIKNLTLLSPFYNGAPWQGSVLGANVSIGSLNFLYYVLQVKKIKLSNVYKLSGKKYRDLLVLLNDPEHYTQTFSLKSAKNIMDITKSLKLIRNNKTSGIDTFVAYSESDQTISTSFVDEFLDRHFTNVKRKLVIEESLNIPHEIVVPDQQLNPYYENLYSEVGDFLENSFM